MDSKELIHMDNIPFQSFYKLLTDHALTDLKKMLEKNESCYSKEVYINFTEFLTGQLQSICTRTLIAEMHAYKANGQLQGTDEVEEYEYFCTHMIADAEKVNTIFEKYAVLKKLVEDRIKSSIDYYVEIIGHFQKDRSEIEKKLGIKNRISRITRIENGCGDSHNGGRQVAKIQMDGDIHVLYKPHTMNNEQYFMELLYWISKGIGITQFEYKILSFENHSWCTIVPYKSCTTEEEIKRYYRRLGVQLFVAYSIGTHDLHCENIIAAGEYPVIIDLETLVHSTDAKIKQTAAEEVYHWLRCSVLGTGLLPFFMWNKAGTGIDCSGISGEGEHEYPFKIPTVMNPGTSNMRIDYAYPKSKRKQNLVMLNGQICSPVEHEDELMEGFSLAYQYVLDNKEEFIGKIKRMSSLKSRFLIGDTQRYSMSLASSYHPSLLKDSSFREAFLMSLCERRAAEEQSFAKDEVKSILQGDIPYYEQHLDSKHLYSATGEKWDHFFSVTPMELLLNKIDKLNKKDMYIQMRYIRMSLELTVADRKYCENKVYHVEREMQKDCLKEQRNSVEDLLKQLIDRMINEAIWNEKKTEVNWCQVILSSEKNMTWSVGSMDMYLYSGLAGMLLLFYELYMSLHRKEAKDIYIALQNTIFSYTESCEKSLDNMQSHYSGAYEGESSIVYTYILLYKESNDNKYLDYAKRHMKIVEQLIGQDTNYDLLSGNAGAAYVSLMLYDVTKEMRYLQVAERAVEILDEKSEHLNDGMGWTVRSEIPPMSGMAHGNAGILMPVMALWKKTGKKQYEKMAEKIWKYEESLYEEEIDNWLDVRDANLKEEKTGAVAWCHGAGGILLSRMYCNEFLDDVIWKERMKKDIERAYAKLSGYWKRDSWSLCHGISGNLWILNKYENQKNEKINVENFKLLPQELINPGFMNGYGGMIYYLIKK